MTGPAAAGGNLARLGRRLLSLAYETLILAAVWLAGSAVFAALAGRLEPQLARPALQVFLMLLAGLYFVWQWRHGGQTLPMKTWRIRVVTVTGAPLALRHALMRFVFGAAGTLCFGAGIVWALFDRDRQFLHDRLAGTRLVKDEGGRMNP